jgi:hypothetical protein
LYGLESQFTDLVCIFCALKLLYRSSVKARPKGLKLDSQSTTKAIQVHNFDLKHRQSKILCQVLVSNLFDGDAKMFKHLKIDEAEEINAK